MGKIKNIVTTATRMFSEYGYENTTVNEIAKEAGVAGGTIIYHFKSKENLLFIVTWDILNSLYKHALSSVSTSSSGMSQVTDFINAFFDFLHKEKGAYKTLLRNTHFDTLDVRGFPNADLSIIRNRYMKVLEDALSKGVEDGTIKDIQPGRSAAVIYSMLSGAARMYIYYGEPLEALREESLAFSRARLTN